MFMLIKLFYEFISESSKYQNGWKRYIIYPFVRLLYLIRIRLTVWFYIERVNDILDFRSIIIEYVNFLTVMKKLSSKTPNMSAINNSDSSTIHVIYDENENIKSLDYIFKENLEYSDNTSIKISTNNNRLLLIEVRTMYGITSFSYNSLIDSKLIGIKDSVEKLIRTDIAENAKRILISESILGR